MPQHTFAPPGNLDDFNPAQRSAWSQFIGNYLAARKTAGDVQRNQFFSLADQAVGADKAELPIRWTAFPKQVFLSSASDRTRWRKADSSRDLQDEYCEWSVERDATNKIKRVTFTCEGPEYWSFLARSSPDKALDLYRQHVSPSVQQQDLFTASGAYIERNRWNSTTKHGAMHLIQPANTLRAEMELAAAATVRRRHDQNEVVTEQELIDCSQYGVPTRHSDPHIGAEVNALARKGALITLLDPVGLYLDGLSTAGWSTPDGADPQSFWRVTRGSKELTLRAVYEVTAGHDYLVGDIKINGLPIEFGAQIADHIQVRLTGLAHAFGTAAALLHPCIGAGPQGAPGPLSVEDALGPMPITRR